MQDDFTVFPPVFACCLMLSEGSITDLLFRYAVFDEQLRYRRGASCAKSVVIDGPAAFVRMAFYHHDTVGVIIKPHSHVCGLHHIGGASMIRMVTIINSVPRFILFWTIKGEVNDEVRHIT